jgi:transposase
VTVAVSKPAPFTAQAAPLLSARNQLDVITAYRQVGTYRGAAEICGVSHKTVKRIVQRGEAAEERVSREKNYERVRELVADEMVQTKGRISALRLLPKARAGGFAGSDRNFRRLVAEERGKYRQGVWRWPGPGGRRSGRRVVLPVLPGVDRRPGEHHPDRAGRDRQEPLIALGHAAVEHGRKVR